MRATSTSTATSPVAATAWPPLAPASRTVSLAAASSTSATMTRAPSLAKSRLASRPMPLPAPEINATLSFKRCVMSLLVIEQGMGTRAIGPPMPRRNRSLWSICRAIRVATTRDAVLASYPLEVAHELPIGDGLIEGLLFQSCRVEVVIDDAVAEGRARHLRTLELGDGLAQRLGDLGQRAVLVGVALVELRRLEAALDAVQAGRDGGREGEIRIRVGAGHTVFHAEGAALSAEAESARAIVPARDDPGGRERARLVSLVGV